MEEIYHQFEKKKIISAKCVVCHRPIWSSAYTCSLCECNAHKSCTVKILKELCGRKPSESHSPETPKYFFGRSHSKSNVSEGSIASPAELNSALEIFFSDGSSKTIPYQPDVVLFNILNQIREEKELDGSYIIYDKAGKVINHYDQSLKKLKYAFPLFYTVVESTSKNSRRKIDSKKRMKFSPGADLKSPHKSNRRSFLGQKKLAKKSNIEIESLEQRNGTISITVVTVSDLANQTSAYKLLYFSLTNLDTNLRHRSKLLENTANPSWNQTIKFHMPIAYGLWNIKIWAIRKIDSNSPDVLLGETDFELKNFKDGDSETRTLIIKPDNHKKDKKTSRKFQMEFLQTENHRLNLELEMEKKQRDALRTQLDELQKASFQQQSNHTLEMNSIISKYSAQNTEAVNDPAFILLKQKEQLLRELHEIKKEFQLIKLREEESRKKFEEQIDFYKVQAEKSNEAAKKLPKLLLQWSYQDRKLKGGQPSEEDDNNNKPPQRRSWIPTATATTGDDLQETTMTKKIAIQKNNEPDKRISLAPDQGKNKRIQDIYDFGEVLGTGGSSIVREGIHKQSSQRVAIKILDNYDNVEDASEEEEAFWAEIEIIKQLDHPCILNVYDFYEDSEHYYVVLELLSGNELFDQIIEKGYYEEPEAVAIIYQVLLALEHLESKNICHLDLKPENILFTDDTHTRVKLIDFGEAASCKDHKLTGWVGTNNYMAPEMIKHLEYDCKVDMWSMGVVSYIMLCGSFAFDADDEIELYQDIMEMRYEFKSPDWDHVSEDAKNFVTSLLTGPNERLSASQALNHRWIKTNLPLSGFDPKCLV